MTNEKMQRDGLKNQGKGAGRQVEGKIREVAGVVTGNRKEEAKGKGQQVAGTLQKKVGEVQERAGR